MAKVDFKHDGVCQFFVWIHNLYLRYFVFLSDWHGLSLIVSDVQVGFHRVDKRRLSAILLG